MLRPARALCLMTALAAPPAAPASPAGATSLPLAIWPVGVDRCEGAIAVLAIPTAWATGLHDGPQDAPASSTLHPPLRPLPLSCGPLVGDEEAPAARAVVLEWQPAWPPCLEGRIVAILPGAGGLKAPQLIVPLPDATDALGDRIRDGQRRLQEGLASILIL